MSGKGRRAWPGPDGRWTPAAYVRRLARSTYARVDLMRSRWERPWRWCIFNLAATNYQRILAHGDEPDAKAAMQAAMKEYACRSQRARLAEAARKRNAAIRAA